MKNYDLQYYILYKSNNDKFIDNTSIILSISFLLLFQFVSKAKQKYVGKYKMNSEMILQTAKQFIDSIAKDLEIKR
jgi:hypothetical protein